MWNQACCIFWGLAAFCVLHMQLLKETYTESRLQASSRRCQGHAGSNDVRAWSRLFARAVCVKPRDCGQISTKHSSALCCLRPPGSTFINSSGWDCYPGGLSLYRLVMLCLSNTRFLWRQQGRGWLIRRHCTKCWHDLLLQQQISQNERGTKPARDIFSVNYLNLSTSIKDGGKAWKTHKLVNFIFFPT